MEFIGRQRELAVLDSELRVTAFGVGETGELFVADLNGGIYRVRVD